MSDEPLFPRRQPCPCGSGRKFKDCCEKHVSGDKQVSVDESLVIHAEIHHPGTIANMIAGFDAEIAAKASA